MNFINSTKFTLDKYDYTKYLFIFILIIILIKHFSNIFSNRNILIIIVSSFIIYIFMNFRVQNLLNDYKKYTNKLNLIRDDSLIYLNKDLDILSIYASIIDFRKYNPNSFQNSLNNMNLFLSNYNDIKNENISPIYIYESAVYRRSEALNNLLTMVLKIPKSLTYLNTEAIDPMLNNINDNKLMLSIENLKKITLKYLTEMEIIINERWTNELTYNHVKPVYSFLAKPNPAKDLLYNKYFTIYGD